MSVSQAVRILSFVVVCTAAVGCSCAKKEDLDALRSDMQQSIKAASDQAAKAATNAAEARRAAEEANSRSLKTEEALNRGFKKSMRK